MSAGPRLELSGITVSIDGHPALRDVSFVAPSGGITVVMGDRGGGKSLLAQYVTGQAEPDRGQVTIDGQPVASLSDRDRRQLRKGAGILRGGNRLRESELSESATVLDNLTEQLIDADRIDNARDARHAARACLEDFDLFEVADQRPADLDPNHKRRVAIAAALLSDPELVVLDDPGSGIDINHLETMCRSIAGWHRRTQATVLLTTHSIELAKTLGQHLVVLADGQLAAEGKATELLASIEDQHGFHQRFGATLSFSEADPQRLRRDLHKPSPRALLTIGVLLVLIVIFAIVLLF